MQVFDKLSDQVQLTGFDDGNSEKTINLKLKKDKKKGMFGKVNAGAGTDGRYEGKFNANSFKDVYITKLRSYLKGDTKLEILTIKGIGYRFVVG